MARTTTRTYVNVFGLVIGLAIFVAACTPSGPTEPSSAEISSGQLPDKDLPFVQSNETKVTKIDKIPADIMHKLKNDAAAASGKDADSLTVLRAERVTWNDGAMGCPQPDMMYTQALVEGYWVVLRAEKEEYDYRATLRGNFTRCLSPTKNAPIRYDDT